MCMDVHTDMFTLAWLYNIYTDDNILISVWYWSDNIMYDFSQQENQCRVPAKHRLVIRIAVTAVRTAGTKFISFISR